MPVARPLLPPSDESQTAAKQRHIPGANFVVRAHQSKQLSLRDRSPNSYTLKLPTRPGPVVLFSSRTDTSGR